MMTVSVANKLPGAMQLMQVPMIVGAGYTAGFSRLPIFLRSPKNRRSQSTIPQPRLERPQCECKGSRKLYGRLTA